MKKGKLKISIVGAGNVAFHLARVLCDAGVTPKQILVRNSERYADFQDYATIISDFGALSPCDILILAVNDDAVSEVVQHIPLKNTLIVHTSGSLPEDAAALSGNKYGVFYPLQTFSRDRTPDFKEIPLFIEAEDQDSLQMLEYLALKITTHVHHSNYRMRSSLHLAAVFVSNFSHALYALAEEYLQSESIPFSYLHPLIRETAAKAVSSDLFLGQTGPARRKDLKTFRKHMKMLDKHPEKQEIYNLISTYILKKYHPDYNE